MSTLGYNGPIKDLTREYEEAIRKHGAQWFERWYGFFLGMIKKDFSENTIETLGRSLEALPRDQFIKECKRLLDLLESGATEQEMLEAAK